MTRIVEDSSVPNIERVDVDADVISKFASEEEFVGLAVDLLIEVGQFVGLAACMLPAPRGTWDRAQAVIGGHMVRLYKLISALLDQTCQHRRETSFVFARLAFETIVNAVYLIRNCSPELSESYIKHSMRHEKRLRERIHQNIEARGGEKFDVERRMLGSITRSAEASGVDLDQLELKQKDWGGKNLYEKAESVGLGDAYLGAFAGPSHSVHGNWQDLLEYHLELADDGGFKPELEWHRPRPQILTTVAKLSVRTAQEYFQYLAPERAGPLNRELQDLHDRLQLAVSLHDGYLFRTAAN